MSENKTILELQGVHKSYGNIHALRDINLKVNEGEVLCLLGDNGAGKSTLIKICLLYTSELPTILRV